MDRVLLTNMRRFLQQPGCCAFAAIAEVGNYYDRRIDYDYICSLKQPDGEGLYTSDIAILLNQIGFTNVKVISADVSLLDSAWRSYSRNKLVESFKKMSRARSLHEGYRLSAKGFSQFLADTENHNSLEIDFHLGDRIREALDDGKPVLASFNWNLFFGIPKSNDKDEIDPIKGESENHQIVIYGYDEKGVNILDSHHEFYKRKLKKYGNGRYKIGWEVLMTVMGAGEIIIPSEFVKDRIDELVSCEESC